MNNYTSLFLHFIMLFYIFAGSLYVYSNSLINLKNYRLNDYQNNERKPIMLYLSEIIPLIISGSLIVFSIMELSNFIKNS